MAKKSKKNCQKMAKNIIETLKICITRNPLLNNILRPFKTKLNHTKNGQKRQKNRQNTPKFAKIEKNGHKRHLNT